LPAAAAAAALSARRRQAIDRFVELCSSFLKQKKRNKKNLMSQRVTSHFPHL